MKSRRVIIILLTVVIIALIYVAYPFNGLYIQVKSFEHQLKHTSVPVSIINHTGQKQLNSTDPEINYYRNTTDAIISRADSVIAFIVAIAAMFTILTIFLSMLNFHISSELYAKLESVAKLKDEFKTLQTMQDDTKCEIEKLKSMQYWVEGIVYRQANMLVNAIEKFKKAEETMDIGMIKLELADIRSDMFSKKLLKNKYDEKYF